MNDLICLKNISNYKLSLKSFKILLNDFEVIIPRFSKEILPHNDFRGKVLKFTFKESVQNTFSAKEAVEIENLSDKVLRVKMCFLENSSLKLKTIDILKSGSFTCTFSQLAGFNSWSFNLVDPSRIKNTMSEGKRYVLQSL